MLSLVRGRLGFVPLECPHRVHEQGCTPKPHFCLRLKRTYIARRLAFEPSCQLPPPPRAFGLER